MKKLKNGWLHKKSFQKAIIWSSVVILAGIGFTIYQIFGREANALMSVLWAGLFLLIGFMVFTMFYSKDLREFSDQVSKVYNSMDPSSFYQFIESLDLSILSDETVTKIAFFMAWFKHFEGKNEEAKELFYAKAVDPFPYPNMISLKCLIEIYLLDDKNLGYEVVHKNLDQLEASNLKPKFKEQMKAEINGQILRLDCINRCESNDDIIESLKGNVAPFEYAQNQLFLAYLLKDKDPKQAYFARDYVLNNYGKLLELKNIAEKLVIDFTPTEEDILEHEKELHPENFVIENKEENNEVVEEVIENNEIKEETIEEENKE